MNEGISKDNVERKKKFQGGCLWKEDFLHGRNGTNQKKQQVGLSEQVDFSKDMQLWRFKEIKCFVPIIMKDETMKDDDWWKFKE